MPRRPRFASAPWSILIVGFATCGSLGLGGCRERGEKPTVEPPAKPTVTATAGAAKSASALTETPAVSRAEGTALVARALELGRLTDAAARKRGLAELFKGLSHDERALLLEILWATGDKAARAVFAEVFALWCEADVIAAAKWAASMWDEIPGREGESLREQAGLAWAAQNFAPAFAWALTLRDVGGEWSLAAKMLKEVALRDPQRALALARGVSSEFYAAASNRIFAGWVEHDPAAAFSELGMACKDSSMFAHRLGKWANRDPAATVRWLLANDDRWLGSLSGFVEDKGALVSALFEAQLDWSTAKYGINSLPSFLNNWIRDDAARALAWIDALPEGAEKTALIEQGAKQRSWDAEHRFIPSSLPLILRLPPGTERDALMSGHLQEWGRSDAEAALRWAKEHQVGDATQEAVVVGAMSGLAKDDPQAALDFLKTLPEGEMRGRAERELAAGWAATQAKAAAEWLNARQPGWLTQSWGEGGRDQKYRIVAGWLDADPEALFAWATAHGDKEEAQIILSNAAGTLASTFSGQGKPERAIELLLRLPAESQARRGQLTTIFGNLVRSRQTERAEKILNAQPGLTAEQRREILEAAKKAAAE